MLRGCALKIVELEPIRKMLVVDCQIHDNTVGFDNPTGALRTKTDFPDRYLEGGQARGRRSEWKGEGAYELDTDRR